MKIGEWLTGKELMEKWKIKPFELLMCIKEGHPILLQPYSPASLQTIEIESFLIVKNPFSPKPDNFDPSYDQKVEHVDYLLPGVSECVFRQVEVEKFENEYPELLSEEAIRPQIEGDKKVSKKLTDLKEEEYLENPAIIQLIKEADEDIKIIYNAMIKDARSRKVAFINSTPSDLQQVAIDTLDNPEYSFKQMDKKYLLDPNFYTETRDSSHPKRYFRETLLQQIIKNKTHLKEITKRKIRNLLKKINSPTTAPPKN